MLTSDMIKSCARESGADLVGIAPISRFAGAPKETHPRGIYPECQSVIVLANRILEGSYKGIQEGTEWSSYWIYGYGTGIYGSLGTAVHNVRSMLEEYGYEAPISPGGHTLLEAAPARPPVAPGKLPSNVSIHMRLAAAAAGLGEIGWSKVFLTPQFGPRQRFEIILTDAVLEGDPLYRDHICTRCMACVRACPGHALSETKRVSVMIEDREFSWGEVHLGKCKLTHWGFNKLASPFMIKDMPGFSMDIDEQDIAWQDAFKLGFRLADRTQYIRTVGLEGFDELHQGTRPGTICGATGCVQACYQYLRKTGRVGREASV